MAGYKVPREVSFHDVFPRDAAGKLLKRQLREPYWAGRAGAGVIMPGLRARG